MNLELERLVPPKVRAFTRIGRMRWRRSLFVRVVAATIALGVVVVFVVGQVLLQRIQDQLVQFRMTSSLTESKQLTDQANQFYSTSLFGNGNSFPDFAKQLMNNLAGPVNHPLRSVIMETALNSDSDRLQFSSLDITPDVIPAELRRAVVADPKRQHGKVISIPVQGGDGQVHVVQAIAVGAQVEFHGYGKFELYSVTRLDREVQILDFVQQTFLVGGAALVLLVGGVAWVVTRQVVAPVRQAARTAEELAAGRLDRRMRVRGEDDLARLGRAFNEMAASLERQIHQLEELSRVQRRFVSDVSHELRTPLTTIRMAGEVIHQARHDFQPAVGRSAELLQAQLDRFESLLSDLLEVSRFDAGAAVLDLEACDVRSLVHRAVEGLKPLAERRGSHLDVRAPEPAVAEIDARRIERVVRNLVGNAIEHGEGGVVQITVATDAEALAIGVRDYGVGLRQAEQRLVFNRFWRADPARARNTGGTGLGLAIALEDAHLHGGWLQVWGQPGLGAHFRLTVPLRAGVLLASSPLPLIPLTSSAAADSGFGTAAAAADSGAAADADAESGSAARLPIARLSEPPMPTHATAATTQPGPEAP